MSCSCGCDKMPMTNGIMLSGSRNVPPLTGGFAGLGDDGSDIDSVVNDFALDPGIYGPGGAGAQLPISVPYTPAGVTPSTPSATTNLLSSLATSFAATAQQILKANAGALPTYQTVNPVTGATTTIYGSNVPSTLSTDLLSATTGSTGTLLLVGGAVLLLFMFAKK